MEENRGTAQSTKPGRPDGTTERADERGDSSKLPHRAGHRWLSALEPAERHFQPLNHGPCTAPCLQEDRRDWGERQHMHRRSPKEPAAGPQHVDVCRAWNRHLTSALASRQERPAGLSSRVGPLKRSGHQEQGRSETLPQPTEPQEAWALQPVSHVRSRDRTRVSGDSEGDLTPAGRRRTVPCERGAALCTQFCSFAVNLQLF